MRTAASVLALIIAATTFVARPAMAEAPGGCETPAYLVTSDAKLDKVKAAVTKSRKLDILIVGSASSTIQGADGPAMAYPKRLEERLRELLPGVTVNVATELFPRKSAEETVEILEKLVESQKPDLIVWQTGTVDALRSFNQDDFQTALDDGLQAIKNGGADAILMNLQYSPRTETMISGTPYLDGMRVAAQQHEVPLLDRFGIMRHWSDTGQFDFFGNSRGSGMAKRVHDCLGRALAGMVIEAARINPAELRVQR